MTSRRVLHLGWFVLVPALSAVTPLIAIPAITSAYGAAGWEAYALGLSIGAAAAVVIELGWPLTGPQRVASESGNSRWRTLVSSLRTRVLALIVLGPIAMGIAAAVASIGTASLAATSALMTLASASAALSANWYFVGVGKPLRILVSDALPRALLVTGASLAVLWGAPLEAVPVALLLASAISPVAGLALARHERSGPACFTLRDDIATIRHQFSAIGGRSIGALYAALPITLVSVFAPTALASFAAADRLMRMSLAVLQSVPNALQNWLGSSPTPTETDRRVGVVLRLNAALGVVCGIGFALLAPWVSSILFSGEVAVDRLLAALSGIVLALVCVTRALGPLALVRYGRIHAVTLSAGVGAAVGVPAICIGALLAGAAGAVAGEIVAELSAGATQAVVLVQVRRRGRDT